MNIYIDVFNDDPQDLTSLMAMYGKDDWLNELPKPELQKHFDNW